MRSFLADGITVGITSRGVLLVRDFDRRQGWVVGCLWRGYVRPCAQGLELATRLARWSSGGRSVEGMWFPLLTWPRTEGVRSISERRCCGDGRVFWSRLSCVFALSGRCLDLRVASPRRTRVDLGRRSRMDPPWRCSPTRPFSSSSPSPSFSSSHPVLPSSTHRSRSSPFFPSSLLPSLSHHPPCSPSTSCAFSSTLPSVSPSSTFSSFSPHRDHGYTPSSLSFSSHAVRLPCLSSLLTLTIKQPPFSRSPQRILSSRPSSF